MTNETSTYRLTRTDKIGIACLFIVTIALSLFAGWGMKHGEEEAQAEQESYSTVYSAASDLCVMRIDGTLRNASSDDHMARVSLALTVAQADGASDDTLHDAFWAGVLTSTVTNCGQGQHGYIDPTDAEINAVADAVLAAVQH